MDPFEALYSDYRDDVYHFLLKLTAYQADLAEEMTQETFYQAILSFGRFRGSCHVKSWLCQIAKNTYYKKIRSSRREEEYVKSFAHQSQQPDMEGRTESAEFSAAVLTIIRGFDSKTRDVMLYRLFADLPYRQISALLGISEESARVIFSRGKVRLRDELIKEGYSNEV